MVIIKPFKVLVCLAIASLFFALPVGRAYTSPEPSGGIGLQGEALSADPTSQPASPIRSIPSQSIGNPFPQPYAQRTYRPQGSNPGPEVTYNVGPQTEAWPAMPAYGPTPAVCPPQGCPPQPYQGGSLLPPFLGMFGQPGLAFGPFGSTPLLPRISCKQFSLVARLWKAKLNSTTVKWGTDGIGGPGTDLDLHDDLGLSKNKYIPEYEGRCQIRPNWGIRFSFMPYQYKNNTWNPNGFYFGNILFPPGLPILTTWNRNVYNWSLVYDWYQGSFSASSIFAGYTLYDDKLTVSTPIVFWSRRRSSGWRLASAGLSLEKAIRILGTGTASGNCKGSLQFCEGYFGWDGYATARIAVPMDCGRFGYVECGWRWSALQRGYPTNTDKTSLDGCTIAAGLVF